MRPIRFGMVGGGVGSFIGEVHRRAAMFDGQAVFAAGALSSDPERSRTSGVEAGLAADRAYGHWQEMLERELSLPDDERIEFVSIVTPNNSHYEIARAFVDAGMHVALDKPMVHEAGDARRLVDAVDSSGVEFMVTYNYTGYPMVREARHRVQSGSLGTIRKVVVEYHQGWLATDLESTGMKQAAWRTDPAQAGAGGALGDIGTHAENLLAFVTGLEIESLCADLSSFVPGRVLDDDASVLLRFKDGAKGTLSCSQVCPGEGNNLTLRVYGSEGGLTWRQEQPELLRLGSLDGPARELVRGGPDLSQDASDATRLPQSHPEGFNEAFANLYTGFCERIRARADAQAPTERARLLPTVQDGARGVAFVQRCVESAEQGSAWVTFGS